MAGSTVELQIGAAHTPGSESLTGYGSTWQCWVDDEWVDTHLLVHDGDPLAGQPGATTTAPAIGIEVPATFEIGVPDVEPGWYRITAGIAVREDSATGPPATLTGHIAVEVTEAATP